MSVAVILSKTVKSKSCSLLMNDAGSATGQAVMGGVAADALSSLTDSHCFVVLDVLNLPFLFFLTEAVVVSLHEGELRVNFRVRDVLLGSLWDDIVPAIVEV